MYVCCRTVSLPPGDPKPFSQLRSAERDVTSHSSADEGQLTKAMKFTRGRGSSEEDKYVVREKSMPMGKRPSKLALQGRHDPTLPQSFENLTMNDPSSPMGAMPRGVSPRGGSPRGSPRGSPKVERLFPSVVKSTTGKHWCGHCGRRDCPSPHHAHTQCLLCPNSSTRPLPLPRAPLSTSPPSPTCILW